MSAPRRSATWNLPTSDLYPTLSAECVHVWRAQLELECAARSRRLLSVGERERAARFRFERDRRRFEVGHVMLRSLLGRYLGRSPGSLRFVNNVYGKPALDDQDASIRFNLSHSRDTVLCAITVAHDVGVDVEFVRNDVNWLGIAAMTFGAVDCERLKELPQEQAAYTFFEMWVQREAVLKAAGVGLSGALETRSMIQQWTVQTLDVGIDYRAAVALEPSVTDVMCLEWLDYL